MGWGEAADEAGEHVPSSVIGARAVEGMVVDETRVRGRRSTARSSLILLPFVFTLLMGMARAGMDSRLSLIHI